MEARIALGASKLSRSVAPGAAASLVCLAAVMPMRADTLDRALALAYQNNPQLNSQRAVVRETDEGVPQALSGYRPTIAATATIGEQYSSTVSKVVVPGTPPSYPRTSAASLPSTAGVTVTQNLFDGFQTANRTRFAETGTSAARETLRVTEQTVLQNAASAYMDLLRDGAQLDLQRQNVQVLQEQLRQTRDRFNVSEVTRTDVAQAESRLAQGRAAVLSAEAQFLKSKAIYRQVIGVEPGTLAAAAPVDHLTPRRMADAIELGRARHPNVGVAAFGIDSAVLQVKISEGALYPQAKLVGSIQQSWQPDVAMQLLQQFNAFVQAQVTVPLYQGGAEYAQIRQAKETVGQKRIDLDTARDQVQANIVTVWGQLDAAKAQILATQAQVAAAETAVNGVREEAKVGQRTTLDVLNSLQELVNARTALLSAQHDRVVASYSLLAAVGELNLPKIGINIPLYDPMVHYQQVRDAWGGVRTPDGR